MTVPEHLLQPRPNVFRLALHPDGLAARLVNLTEVRALFLDRLQRQVNASGDPELRALHDEVRRYPVAEPDGGGTAETQGRRASPIEVPVRVRTPNGVLSMFSTMATFGAPADVTLSEMAIELFYPLDAFTAAALRATAGT